MSDIKTDVSKTASDARLGARGGVAAHPITVLVAALGVGFLIGVALTLWLVL